MSLEAGRSPGSFLESRRRSVETVENRRSTQSTLEHQDFSQFFLWLSCFCEVAYDMLDSSGKPETICVIEVPKEWAREANQSIVPHVHRTRPIENGITLTRS
jgi:hypothetical protein